MQIKDGPFPTVTVEGTKLRQPGASLTCPIYKLFQLSFWANHSTETAITKVIIDLL